MLAQDIYDALAEKGYKVFFSRISLEEKLGTEYEPYIFAALNSAKIMLAVGTDYEYYNAVWVKNEWSRYLKLMAQDKNKHLIPCYKGLDAYDMPPEFSKLQAQDLGKVGAMQDLLRGIEKLLPKKKQTEVIRERVLVSDGGNVAPLLRRVAIFLEDRDWDSADKYCEKVLDMDPENSEAYLGKLMAEYKVSTEEDMGKLDPECLNSANYQKALRFGDDAMAQRLENIRRDTVYYEAKRLAAKKVPLEQQKGTYREAIARLQTIPGWRDSGQQTETLRSLIRDLEEQEEAARQEKQRREQLARQQEAERKKQAEKKNEKTAHALKIGLSALCAVVALAILINTVVLPMLAGKKADAPAANATQPAAVEPPAEESEATEATAEPVSPEYIAAVNLLAQGKTAEAAIAFGKLGDYRDARERSLELWKQIPRCTFDIDFTSAVGLKNDGTVIVTYAASDNEFYNARLEKVKEITSGWRDIVSVNADHGTMMGLRMDGKVEVAFGDDYGETADAYRIISSWEDVVYFDKCVALKADGTVVGKSINTEWDEKELTGWKDVVALSVSSSHVVGVKSDGTVLLTGTHPHKETMLGWENVKAVYAETRRTVGLKSDGTVLICGFHNHKEPEAEKWTDIVAVNSAIDHTVGLKSDGRVVAIGSNEDGQCQVDHWTDVVAIDAGNGCTAGLRSDGTILLAGNGEYVPLEVAQWSDIQLPDADPEDQKNTYAAAEALLANGEIAKAAIAFGKLGDYADARQTQCREWTDIVAVSTRGVSGGGGGGEGHTAGLKKDGTVVAVGANQWNQCDTASWTDIVAIDTYALYYTVGLKADGTVVYTGQAIEPEYSQIHEVSDWKNIAAIRILESTLFGIRSDGTVVTAKLGKAGLDAAYFEDWSDIISVTRCGVTDVGTCYIGLKADGTVIPKVISTKYNPDRSVTQTVVNYNDPQYDMSRWSEIIAVAAQHGFMIGLKSDGRVVSAGLCNGAPLDVSGWADVAAVYASRSCAVGLKKDGTMVSAGETKELSALIGIQGEIALPVQRN